MIDATTWVVLGLTLTLLGLVVSAFVWRARGAGSGLRAVAWSLLPAAAGLTGVLRLLSDIAGSIGGWAVRLVFSPVVWLGIVLAGVSVLLYGVSAALRRRGAGRRAAGPPAVKAKPAGTTVARDDDMDDIEAILRKHGIT